MNQESTPNPIENPEEKERDSSAPIGDKKPRTVRARKPKVEETAEGTAVPAADKVEGESEAKKKARIKKPVAEAHAEDKEAPEKAKTETREKPVKADTEKHKVGKKTPAKTAEESAPAHDLKPAKAHKEIPVTEAPAQAPGKRISELLVKYVREIAPQMIKEFKYKNTMEVPRLKKIVLNIGLGEATTNAKAIESAQKDLATIAGQQPIITRAKRSISAFKLRVGMPIGVTVTLRGKRQWDFLSKLMNIVLPRIRDFQGVPSTSFDKNGNYTLGLKEQIVFPEVEFDKVDKIRGLQITIVTTSRKVEEGKRLLELMGMPFTRS